MKPSVKNILIRLSIIILMIIPFNIFAQSGYSAFVLMDQEVNPICPDKQVYFYMKDCCSSTTTYPGDWYVNGTLIKANSKSFAYTPTNNSRFDKIDKIDFFYSGKVRGSYSLTLKGKVVDAPIIVGDVNFCKGNSYLLTISNHTSEKQSYVWVFPSGLNSVTYGNNALKSNVSIKTTSSSTSGEILVYGTNMCGIGPTTKIFQNVLDLPNSPSVVKDTVFCENESMNLQIKSNDNVSYIWSGPNSFTSSQKNPLVSSSAKDTLAGIYTVQSILNGCRSLPSSVEVIINKAKATVKNSICEGGKLELFASSIPGATYFWTGPNGFLSTLQNPVIDSVKSVKSSGSYMVYTTVNNCTSPVPGQISVNVQPIPEATGVTNNGPLCVGKILSLRTDSIPGATYLWTGPNGFTSTLRNPIVSTNFSTSMIGAYNLNVSLNGCTSQPLTSNVELNKTSASSLPVCVGGDFKLTASNVTGAVYNWTGPNGFTSSLQNPIVSSNATTAMTGVYSVKSIVNGCESPISSIIVSVNQSVSLPTVTENLVYCQNEIASKLNATGVNLKWYFQKEGGNPQLEAPLPLTQSYGKTSYFVTQTTICESKRAEIKVSVVPTSKIFFDGLNAICSGSSKKLIAPVIEGMSFQWKKNGVAISGATDSTLMVNSAGSYSLSTSLGSACKSDAPAVSISLETAPAVTISGPSKICWNGRAMFRASLAGGVWAPIDNTLLLASPQGLFRNGVKPATDNYKSGVSYTVSSKLGACTTKATKNVYVRNVIAPSITISTLKSSIKVNESTTATATTNIVATGTWSSTNTLVSAIANTLNTKTATVKGLRVGSGANVVYFADDATTGCRNAGYLAYSVTAAASMVSVSTNSETSTSNTSLYPNPSNGKFILNSTEDVNSVKLIDISGRVIAIQPIAASITTIDFTGVSSGKYMLQITGDQVNEMQPIVIE